MTDDLQRNVPGEDTYEIERGLETHEIERGLETHEIERGTDAPLEPDGASDPPQEPNPWFKEGADAPDAADIEDPGEQR